MRLTFDYLFLYQIYTNSMNDAIMNNVWIYCIIAAFNQRWIIRRSRESADEDGTHLKVPFDATRPSDMMKLNTVNTGDRLFSE